jgi:serine/threonine protein kinase
MGSVWLAERADGSFKRQVALKLPRLAWGTGLAERMAREREIGALLEHPNIARLYDAGVDERGRPYLALEYIDGQPIDATGAKRKA